LKKPLDKLDFPHFINNFYKNLYNMKIMRVVELNLIADKERLEYHLEETINRKDMDASEKIIVIKETLLELTETINIIQLWSSYIEGLEKNNKVVEGK
tara:strand:- start:22 stop:315 length:294 start_codon:yes stop_codon:yes gene_type:complete